MGLFDEYAIKNKINKLKKAKSDLNDDSFAISSYNKYIDSIISDFCAFVKNGNGTVANQLNGYKEPYQYSDGNLINASNYIQSEIKYQNKTLSEDNGSSGGGAW